MDAGGPGFFFALKCGSPGVKVMRKPGEGDLVARWQVNVSNVAPNVSGHWEGSKNVKLLVARGWPEFCQVNVCKRGPRCQWSLAGVQECSFFGSKRLARDLPA